jgi:hypothetical protein
MQDRRGGNEGVKGGVIFDDWVMESMAKNNLSSVKFWKQV